MALVGGAELLRLPLPMTAEPHRTSEATPLQQRARQQVMLALELAPLSLPAHVSALTVAVTVRGVEVANASLPVVSQMPASA